MAMVERRPKGGLQAAIGRSFYLAVFFAGLLFATPTCTRSFKVSTFHGPHDPEPAPAICRCCRWRQSLAGRKAAEVERFHKTALD